MKIIHMSSDKRSGTVLMIVMGMTLLATIAVGAIVGRSLVRMRIADFQVCTEQAFYVASAGAERAASYVAAGNEYTTTLNGQLGKGSYVSYIHCKPGQGGEVDIDITSEGTVKNATRTVTMRGVRRVSWSKYALWYDQEAMKLWIVPGEFFDGRVYSRPEFHFHDHDLAQKGQVRFTDSASTVASTIETSSDKVKPIFEKGLTTSAERESMASISFPDMMATADNGGLVLEGPTSIELDGSVMKVTNQSRDWHSEPVPIPDNGVLYVKTTTSSSYKWVKVHHRWKKRYVTTTLKGEVDVAAPKGLEGRLTIVAEDDINIVDHVRYKTNPEVNPDSTDALGLIAHDNVVVETSAPNNLDIYAHIIALNGGFGVKKYNYGNSRGSLHVYGGIVNKVRNAVGIVGGSGYAKNYIFDKRFSKFPPPHYPKLTDELEWTEWEG